MKPTHHPSSNIGRVGYDQKSRTLRVSFVQSTKDAAAGKPVAIWDYPDVDVETYRAIRRGESPGREFRRLVSLTSGKRVEPPVGEV